MLHREKLQLKCQKCMKWVDIPVKLIGSSVVDSAILRQIGARCPYCNSAIPFWREKTKFAFYDERQYLADFTV